MDSWAQMRPGDYWKAVEKFLEFRWQKEYHEVLSPEVDIHESQWFRGAEFNISDNCITKWIDQGLGGRTAIRWEIEDGSKGELTFNQFDEAVNKFCNVLAKIGVKTGDRIAMQMPMIWESVVAQLSVAKMGAVLVPIFSGYASEAVVERLILSDSRYLIISEEYERRGAKMRLDDIRIAACSLPSLDAVVLIGDGLLIEGEIRWSDEMAQMPSRYVSPRLSSNHPLLIAYTSGTTGKPKGLTLSQLGFAIKAASDAFVCFDLGRDDVATWITDPGWVMSPITIYGSLLNGSTLAIYSGAIDYPNTERLWRFVDGNEVTFLGVSPTLTRSLMAEGAKAKASIGSLRVMGSSGEPWTPDAFNWLFENAGKHQIPIINYSGGTEVSGGILSNRTIEPIVPCGFYGPIPGMGATILNEAGESSGGMLGELSLLLPSPGMPTSFWGEPERYFETYWARWKNIWAHGDFAEVSNGSWFIRGRSDDTIKVAGKRIGPSEVESIVNSHKSIDESAAIGIPDPIKGEALVVFAKVSKGFDESNSRELQEEVQRMVASQLGKPMKPKAVWLVRQLPKNRSGKILRRVIKSAHLGKDLGDLSSLDNPEALTEIKSI